MFSPRAEGYVKTTTEEETNFNLKMASDVSRDGSENKRKLDEEEDEGGWVGPLPSEATQTKKKKGTFTWFMLNPEESMTVSLHPITLTTTLDNVCGHYSHV